MGAQDFCKFSAASTADDAFKAAVEDAKYNYGNSGYTGTIAEKRSFVLIDWPRPVNEMEMTRTELRAAALKFAEELIEKSDSRIDDKWGPAGCIKVFEGLWLFFGWASS